MTPMPSFPKPTPILHDRVSDKLAAEARMREFRREVWRRDDGLCQFCGRIVRHMLTLDPARGEVHHLRGRNVTPENRYAVDEAVLLCAGCHGRAHRHEITIRRPR